MDGWMRFNQRGCEGSEGDLVVPFLPMNHLFRGEFPQRLQLESNPIEFFVIPVPIVTLYVLLRTVVGDTCLNQAVAVEPLLCSLFSSAAAATPASAPHVGYL